MRTMKQALFLIRTDMWGNPFKMLGMLAFSIFMMGYLGVMSSIFIADTLKDPVFLNRGMTDFMMLALTPLLGFTYSRRMFKYWSADQYTKMLSFLRRMSVPLQAIMLRRKIYLVLSFLFNSLLFFGMIYAASSGIREELDPLHFLAFALTWGGFGLTVTGLYTAFEMLCSGRRYFWYTQFFIIGQMAAALAIAWGNGSVVRWVTDFSQEWALLSPLMWGALALGTLSVQFFSRWTLYQLARRDLL